MKKYVIYGGEPLEGEVRISGSKNAALPLIFSSIVLPGESILRSVPDIGDVRVALDIIKELGAVVCRVGDELRINTENVRYVPPRDELTRKIRASTYLLGACLARFGCSKISDFGGCSFDARPIDMHLSALGSFGAKLSGDELSVENPKASDIYFEKVSVGASINALIMASSVPGVSRIYGFAREPHVMSLVEFFKSAGVEIKVYDDRLEVCGEPTSGGVASVIPDMIEAGTYIAASIVTGSNLKIKGVNAQHLSSFIEPISRSGVRIIEHGDCLEVFGKPTKPIYVKTAPYPGFPTDLQPIIAPVLALGAGGMINECIWKNRFSYLEPLTLFGIRSFVNEQCARILPSHLKPAVVKAPDLRGGAALVLSALAARGESVIMSAETLMRGYENLTEKLSSLGARIYVV